MQGITSQEDLNDIMKNKNEFGDKVRLVEDFSKILEMRENKIRRRSHLLIRQTIIPVAIALFTV
jgi:hypothetical protein